MKKFLLSLCVTMLSFVGAWAQGASIQLVCTGSNVDLSTNSELNPLVLDVNNSSGLRIYFNATGDGNWSTDGNEFVNVSLVEWDNNGFNGVNRFVTITPKSQDLGLGKVNISLKNYYPGDVIASADLWVKVADASKVDVLTFGDETTEKSVDVAKGYPVTVPVVFDPETAVLNLKSGDETPDADGYVTVNGIKAIYNATAKIITVEATDDAEEDVSTATFELSDGVKSISLTAKVVAPTPVTTVTINPTEIKIARGETATFTATTDGANKNVTWSVDDSGVLELTGDGTVKALKHGTGYITATSAEDGTISATATVNVTDMFPLALATPFEKIHIGETIPTDFTVPGVDSEYYTISYNSSKPSVLTVDAQGRTTGVSKGEAEFTVRVTPTTAGVAALWEESVFPFTVVVSQSEYSLTLTPDAATFDLNGVTETLGTAILPMVSLNGQMTDKEAGTDYTIAYDLESPYPGVTVANNGSVSVAKDAKCGIATIVATLVPLGANAADYVGATAKFNVTVSNSGAIATITKLGEGIFDLSIPSAGAFYGTGLSDNPTVTYVGFADNDDVATNIAEFKAATAVSIEGIAANADIQEFTHLVGSMNKENPSKLTDLDMGGLVLTEAVTKVDNSHSFIASDDYWTKRLESVRNFVMPRPSLTAENGTVIPADFNIWFTDNGVLLNKLVISEGWTVVGERAFDGNGTNPGQYDPCQNLESIKLPNSLLRIEANAFHNHLCTTLTFPANLQYIGREAFSRGANGAGKTDLKDVYFTGRTAPAYVDAMAFGGATQMANNAYTNPTDGTATRDNYKAQSGWECMLHYPAGLTVSEKATYEDPTRVYELGDRIATGVDTREATYNYAANSNMYKVVHPWNNPSVDMTSLTASGFGITTYNMEAGFRDLAVGPAYIWPSVEQFRTAYVIAQNGYHWDGTEMTDEEKARIGIYSFVFAKGDATPHHNEEEWILPYKYEQNKWWTICLPFDMSVEKVKEVFGNDTELCLFSKVIRDTETGKLRLEFKRSVMDDSYAAPADKGTGLKAHTPYMIRPAGDVEIDIFTLDGYRKVKGFEIKEGDAQGFSVVAQDSEGNSLEYQGHPWNYTFIGNYQENYYIPQYSYFLSWSKNNPTHRYFFEQGTTRAFNPYTCVVRAYRGGEDNVVFFDGGKSSSAKFASFFGLADDEATKIEEMEIVCGNRSNDKVYSINGQLINSSVLAPGLYIKNGKKFIVK